MTKMNKYSYIAPQTFPIFPDAMGETIVGVDFDALLLDATQARIDADLNLGITVFMGGSRVSEEKHTLRVRNGSIKPKFLRRSFSLPSCGYVEFSLSTDINFFSNLKPELGYAMLSRKDGGFTTIISQPKYSVPVIIDNQRETGTFCLVHQAQYMDTKKDTGNSVFIINPYDGKIVLQVTSQKNKKIKHRIDPRSSSMLSLEPLLNDGEPECLMYTGNNRMICWDVRHRIKNSNIIYNIDHVEYFRAYPTIVKRSIKDQAKKAIRRFLRDTGVWF
jgi:hypothetical protein